MSRDLVTQNAILTDFDGVARRRGERLDVTARASVGYAYDMLPNGPGDQLRVSSAYVDLNDRELGLSGRLGRQSRGMAGIHGHFRRVARLLAMASAIRPRPGGWNAHGIHALLSQHGSALPWRGDGFRDCGAAAGTLQSMQWPSSTRATVDRRSIGLESHYVKPGRTLIAIADYDLHFADFNNIMVVGTLVTDSLWTFNVDASRQRSPMLSSRNALIGQPTIAFEDLFQTFTDAQIEQLALDRSAQLTQVGLSASRPLGDRAQWSASLVSVDLSGTPASGGVEAVPAPGRDDSIASELLVNSLFKAGDIETLAVRYQHNDTGTLMSMGLGSRLPIGSSLRMTTRIRVDHRTYLTDDSTQWTLLPSLRLDYVRGRSMVEFESGAELGRRERPGFSEQSTRYYFSLGYRLYLDTRRR